VAVEQSEIFYRALSVETFKYHLLIFFSMRRIPKRYGESKLLPCPFCTRTATIKNQQGIDVCTSHTSSVFEEIKCTCGRWLEQRSGKFGVYFNCLHCGNINFNKAMEMKDMMGGRVPVPEVIAPPERFSKPKETTITSHDVDYFD